MTSKACSDRKRKALRPPAGVFVALIGVAVFAAGPALGASGAAIYAIASEAGGLDTGERESVAVPGPASCDPSFDPVSADQAEGRNETPGAAADPDPEEQAEIGEKTGEAETREIAAADTVSEMNPEPREKTAEQEKEQEKKAEEKKGNEKKAEEDKKPEEKSEDEETEKDAVPAAPPQTKITVQEGDIQVIARSQQKTSERVFAVGEVEIHYKTAKLFADRVELDPATRDVRAEGNVVLQLPNEVITTEHIFFNLDEATGRLEGVRGMIQPSVYYRAESLEKKPDDLYTLNKVQVTSCSQPTPRWEFTSSRANLKKGDYIEMWNAVFRLGTVPVFYLPYMRYPLERERTTGFLMPSVGFSGPKGFTLSQSFYWAMARNMDATVTADFYSARGLGGGLEYRYLFRDGTQGNANLYYFTFRQDELGFKHDDAYILRLNHSQRLPFGFALVADVDYQTSFDFLREFDNNFRRAVVSNRRSQVFVRRSWGGFNLNARVSQFETFFNELGDAIIRRDLPQISFSSFKIPVFRTVFLSFNSAFTSWEYGWRSQYEAGTQRKAANLSFSPTLSVPFSLIPWMTINSQVTGNFVYHLQSYQANTRNVIEEPLLQRNAVVRFDLVGPVFNRIFRDRDGEAKVKHIVEPYATYNYDSPVGASARIITTWGFFRYHQVRYGLTNRFLVKQRGRTREALTVGVGQTYYIAHEDSPLSRYTVDGEIPRFSEISGYVRYRPVGNMTLDAAAGLNPYTKQVGSIRLGAGLGSQATGNAFMSVNWFKSMNTWLPDLTERQMIWYNRHQIGVNGGWKIPRLGLEFFADTDFNIQERKMLYSAVSFNYNWQCIDIGAEVKVFYFRYYDQPDVQFRINLGLGNIGKTTDFLGGFEF